MHFNKYTLQHKVTLSDLQIFPNFNLKRAAITAIMQFYELLSIGELHTWIICGSVVGCPRYTVDNLWNRATLPNADDVYVTKESRPEKEKVVATNGGCVRDSLTNVQVSEIKVLSS
jgi:hypothetical protein